MFMEAEPVDGALVDLRLPGLNGSETCLGLHRCAARLARTVRIWLMSGVITSQVWRHRGELDARCAFRKWFGWPVTVAQMAEGGRLRRQRRFQVQSLRVPQRTESKYES